MDATSMNRAGQLSRNPVGGKGAESRQRHRPRYVTALYLHLKVIEEKGGEVTRAEDRERRNEKQDEGIE